MTGNVGNVIWQQSTDGGATWVSAVGTASQTQLVVSNRTATTIYRAAVQSGSCAIAYSNIAVVSVIPAFTPTDITISRSTICLGDTTLISATLSAFPPAYLGISSEAGDFNQGAYEGWTRDGVNLQSASGNNGDLSHWTKTNNHFFVDGFDATNEEWDSKDGKFVIVHGAYNSIMYSPVFSLAGLANAQLTFSQALNFSMDGSQAATGTIDIRIGSGAWVNLKTYTNTTFGNRLNYAVETLDLNQFIGLSGLQLRFNYSGTTHSTWSIDNLTTPGGHIPTDYVWNGSDILLPPTGTTTTSTGTSIIAKPENRGDNDFEIITSVGGCPGNPRHVIVKALTAASFPNGKSPIANTTCVGSQAVFEGKPEGDNLVFTWQRSRNGGPWNNVSGGTYNISNVNDATNGINNSSTLTILKTDTSMVDDMYRLRANNLACGDTTVGVPLQLNYVWKGRTSTDWSNPSNWYANEVPGQGCDSVYILSRPYPFEPTINAGYVAPTINNLNVYKNATVTVLGELQIADHISHWGTGTIIARNGTLNLNGASGFNQSIDANTFANNDLFNLNLDNASRTITNKGQLNIYGTLSFGMPISPFPNYNGGGNKNFITSDLVTLKSTAIGTAKVADLTNNGTGSGNVITGKATVERYFPAIKAWRFLAIPTIPGQTVKAAWQEGATSVGQNPAPGFGTMISTVDAGIVTSGGFDRYSAGSTSVKWYDPPSNSYVGLASTFAPFDPTRGGYLTFIRGDRTVTATSAAPTSTTLRTKGNLYQGDQPPVTIYANLFTPVNNPYASPLDLRKIDFSGGMSQSYIVYDPKLGTGSAYGYGAFQTLTLLSDGNYYAFPGGDGSVNSSYPSFPAPSNFIESGQAFFTQAGVSDRSVTLKETSKGAGSGNLVFRGAGDPLQNSGIASLFTNLYVVLPSSGPTLIDGVMNQFKKGFSNKIDSLDIRKLANSGENISIKSGSKLLAVERRPSLSEQDTIFLNFTNERVQKYRFEFIAKGLSETGLQAYIEDHYLNTTTRINMEDTTIFDFSVENVQGSYAPGRFDIVFKQVVIPPPVITSIEASAKDRDITVDWNIINEKNMQQYEVERSFDGIQFAKVTTTAAANAGSSHYSWIDESVLPGYYYYRIRSTDNTGKVQYTKNVKVLVGDGKSLITIYPNPITNGIINLQMINMPAGKYGIRLMNHLGQIIVSKQVERMEGSNIEAIKWNYNLAHGVYQLEIIQPDGSVKVIKVMY